jgi:hypothetical protein
MSSTEQPSAADTRASPFTPAAPPRPGSPLEQFLQLSVMLTGFDEAELHGTGMVKTYYALIPSIIGAELFGRLLSRWSNIYTRGAGDEQMLEHLLTTELLQDETLGPLARNLGALWYLGMWNQLPAAWRNTNGAWAGDTTYILSPQSYTAGLVWKAIHSHPPGAQQPGFGSWAMPPASDPEHT